MSNNVLMQDIYYALNSELLRRTLIKYFFEKGLKEQMNSKLYPPIIQDITIKIPQLSSKIEVVPCVEDIDPYNGVVTLGWNLFVSGNNRIYLGESIHQQLSEINIAGLGPLAMNQGINVTQYATPKKIISFIVNLLGDNKSGDLARSPKALKPIKIGSNLDSSGYFKTERRPVF